MADPVYMIDDSCKAHGGRGCAGVAGAGKAALTVKQLTAFAFVDFDSRRVVQKAAPMALPTFALKNPGQVD